MNHAIRRAAADVWPAITFRQGHPTRPSSQATGEILALNISTTNSDTIVFDTHTTEVTKWGGIDNSLLTSGVGARLNELDFQPPQGTVLILSHGYR